MRGDVVEQKTQTAKTDFNVKYNKQRLDRLAMEYAGEKFLKRISRFADEQILLHFPPQAGPV